MNDQRYHVAEPSPGVALPAQLLVGAGAEVVLPVQVTNTASEPREHTVLAVGVDASWLPGLLRTPVLAPGETCTVELRVTPSVGTLPAQYPLAVTVQPLLPGSSRASAASAGLGETALVVNPRAQVSLEARAAKASFVRQSRLEVVVRNGGERAVEVELEPMGSRGLETTLRRRRLTVPAGGSARTRGRLVVTRPRRLGGPRQHEWTVTASTPEIARRVRGVVEQRALLGSLLVKLMAVVLVMAVWIAAAMMFIPRIADRFGGGDQGVTASAGANKDGGKDGGAGGGAGGGGAGGGGADGGSGAGGSAGGAGASGSGVKVTQVDSAATPKGLQLTGSVQAAKPGGVTVSLRPTALGDPAAAGATPVNSAVSLSSGPVGKIPQAAVTTLTLAAPQATTRSATTASDGTWGFPQVRSPGYYLLSFSKTGYATQRFIVDSATADASDPLAVQLVPGDGALSGAVTGPRGAVDGAKVEISDGQNTLSTSTSSTQGKGTWAVTGLSTPGSYVVQVSKEGLGTESRLVELDASGRARVDLRMSSGVASLSGEVAGGGRGGLGGVAVTVTDSTGVVRTATTATGGQAGFYQLSGLPTPGTYVVSMSGDGYQTETTKVTLAKGQGSRTLNSTLDPATGEVTGQVLVKASASARRAGASGEGAGLVLANPEHVYKTTANSAVKGRYLFSGVTPGTYQLTTSLFGYVDDVTTVVVRAGRTSRGVDPVLPEVRGGVLGATSLVKGSAIDGVTNGLLTCDALTPACLTASITSEDGDTYTTSFAPDEEYTLPDLTHPGPGQKDVKGLRPGVYAVTVSGPHYETTTVRVQVPLGTTVVAPVASLLPAPKITGFMSIARGATTGTNCVYAYPQGTAAPTGHLCDHPGSVSGTCTTPADSTQVFPCAALGSGGYYSVEVPQRGQYLLAVDVADPDYVTPAPVELSVTPDGAQYNFQLNRLGHLTLTVQENTGSLAAAKGATVDLSRSGGDVLQTKTVKDDGTVTFTQLTPGSFTVKATHATTIQDPSQTPSSVPVTLTGAIEAPGVGVSLNQDATGALTLGEKIDAVVARVTSNGGVAPPPIKDATVSVVAPQSYNGDTPNLVKTTMTTNADGCVAVVSSDAVTAPARGACTSGYSGAAKGVFKLLSRKVNEVTISAAGYEPLTVSSVQVRVDAVNEFRLNASPVGFAGTLSAQGGTPDLSAATLKVSSSTTSADITATSDATGTLTWNDSRYPANRVQPGSYVVTASLPGYSDARAELRCEVISDCTLTGLVLKKLGGLTVAAYGPGGAEVDHVIVTLSKPGQTFAPVTSPTDGNAVTFTGLTPGATDYTLRVQGAGFDFDTVTLACSTSADPTVSSPSVVIAPGSDTTCRATLTRLATLVGSVNGLLDNGQTQSVRKLAGVTVVATRCSAPASATTYCTAVDASTRLQATSLSNGTYSLTGTNAVEGITGGTWLLTASLDGWSSPGRPGGAPGTALVGETVVVSAGASGNVTKDVSLIADPVDFSVTLADQYDKTVTSAVVDLLASSAAGATPVKSVGPLTGTATSYDFTDLTPGFYTVRVSGDGLVTTTAQVEVRAGETGQSFPVPVLRGVTNATGTVTGDDRTSGLAGATARLIACGKLTLAKCLLEKDTGVSTNGTTPLQSEVTGADGSFTIANVPDGKFLLRVARRGYVEAVSGLITFDHAGAAVGPLSATLAHAQRTVKVALTPSSGSGDDLSGAEVTLTPAGTTAQQDGNVELKAFVAAGTATFNNVRFGCYTVTAALPAGHYGDVVPPAATTATGTDPCSGAVVVPETGTSGTLTPTVKVLENLLTITTTATAQPGRPAPSQVRVRTAIPGVTGGYDATAAPGSVLLWLPPGTYAPTADAVWTPPNGEAPFWSQVSDSVTMVKDGAAKTLTLALKEVTAPLVVTVPNADATNGQATITVTSKDGGTVPTGYDSIATTGGTVTLKLPRGAWNISATFAAVGTTADAKDVTIAGLTPPGISLSPTPPPPPVVP